MATSKRRASSDTEPGDTTETPAEPGLEGVDFEAALAELETLVGRMEGGELSLEESLAAFERGVKLTRHCQSALKNAELKIKVLTEDDTLADLDLDDLDDA